MNDVGPHKETQVNSTRLHNNLVVESSNDEDKPDPKVNLERDDIVIAVADITCIKVTNRGELILDKWKKKRKRKGFIKIHVAVNIKTKKIVSMDVTKENVHDVRRLLKKLVEDVVSKNNNNNQKVLADDGSYDSKTTLVGYSYIIVIP